MKEQKQRRKGIQIMRQLVVLLKPLLPVMAAAIALGVAGYLCAIFLTILAGYGIIHIILTEIGVELLWSNAGLFLSLRPSGSLCIALFSLAVLRGILHYAEQYCNHFIAFKLLAVIRHKVFAVLRKLCPAKLEGKERGNLIAVLTSDIELLEVFYAHTISPIAIAVLTSLVMVLFIGSFSIWAGLLALAGYLAVGVGIPLMYGRKGAEKGMQYRSRFGEMNSFLLDSFRGMDETLQYCCGGKRRKELREKSDDLSGILKGLNRLEASQKSLTNLIILICSGAMLFLMLYLKQTGKADMTGMLIAVISMMGSFGPAVALANLSNNLNQTLAAGERVLSLLEEEPQVKEVAGKEEVSFQGAASKQVDFSYEKECILKACSLEIPKGKIIGIYGASGSGKSTLLKLLMRFFDVEQGSIEISGRNIKEMNTANIRQMEAYVTQETHLFHDSIADNIAVGRPSASREEIMEAAKKAAIHEFIMTLPKQYDTQVGELGDTLSGGERQRIGIARAFLCRAPFLLLDEPTSNLDALNEGMILKALKEVKETRTILLVSHRRSTMNLAEKIYKMENGRLS